MMTTYPQTFRFARALFATNLKASLMLRGAFIMQVVFMALNNVAFFVFWWALMRRVPDLRGWRLGDIQVLFGVVAAGVGLAVSVGGGVRHLARWISDGELDTLLVQPKPVLLYAVGMRSQASGFGDILSGIAFIVWSGKVSWTAAPIVVAAIVGSAIVFLASGVVFFSLTFWLGKVELLARQLWEVVVMFSLYPEPLFGGVLRFLLFTALPAGFVGYVPARVVQHPSVEGVTVLIGAVIVYSAAAITVFNCGLRRYASGSRFGTFG